MGTPVLHLVNGEHYAGAERVQDLLALRLPECGFLAELACVKPGVFGRMRKAQDAPLHDVPMRGRFDLRPARRVAEIARRDGCRLVHAHTPRTAMIGRVAAWLARVPMVYHVHSPASRDTTRRLRNWTNAAIERVSLTGVARLICVSESLARHMERAGYPRRRIAVVPNGVPAANGAVEGDASHLQLCRKWDASPSTPCTLGAVALFRPRKGTEVLLEALAMLVRQGAAVRLRAVGPFETPEYEAAVRGRAHELGVAGLIEWTGLVQNVQAELARMDLFVLPSLFGEGMPMVVLEAMAAGVPVVASRVEGVSEAIRDRVDGVLVAPGDPGQLAAAIAGVLRGEPDGSALRAAALARHAERFSDRAMAAGVAAVYRDVLGIADERPPKTRNAVGNALGGAGAVVGSRPS